MAKLPAFSLIELMTTITIMGILMTIAAPDYARLRDKNQYLSEVKGLQDTIADARTNAITNRKCNNSGTLNVSTSWQVVFEPTASSFSYRLECLYGVSSLTIEQASITSLETEIEGVYIDESVTVTALVGVDSIDFEFLSGNAQSSLHYDDTSADVKLDHIRIVFGHDDTDHQQSICQGRVAGFPTHSKSTNLCLN